MKTLLGLQAFGHGTPRGALLEGHLHLMFRGRSGEVHGAPLVVPDALCVRDESLLPAAHASA